MPTPDIVIVWKKSDGTSCVLSRRGTNLVLLLQVFGNIQREEVVESPRHALDLAREWQTMSVEPSSKS